MKKKILLLILSTFIIKADDCTNYVDIPGIGAMIEFCESAEEQCFTNMLNSTLQSQVISDALNCSTITNAIANAPTITDLTNNVPTIVKAVLWNFFFSTKDHSCDSLVNDYIGYAQYNCPPTNGNRGALEWQCQQYAKYLGSDCKSLANFVAGAIEFGENVFSTAKDLYNETVSGAEDVGSKIASGAEDVGRSIASAFSWL